MTVDGQEAVELLLGDRMVCRRSEREVRLLRLHDEWAVQCAAVEAELGRAVRKPAMRAESFRLPCRRAIC